MDKQKSTDELIQLALTAPEETEDYRQTQGHFVYLLHCRGDREVYDRAVELTQSTNANEKAVGIWILGQLGIPDRTFPEDCVDVLLNILEIETDPLFLESIGIALGHLRNPRAVEPLLRFVLHPDWEVRFGVTHGLMGQTDHRAIQAMIQLSADEQPEIRNWATFGLGSICDQDAPEIREALYQRLLADAYGCDDTIAEIHGEALVGLASRKDERAISFIIAALNADFVGKLAIDAEIEFADPRLHPALMTLQAWYPHDLIEALKACQPN